MHHEWVILANLFLLLMGFAILSRHFENSRVPDAMPAFLPNGWTGGLALLAIVFVLSGFLDNIAAALIGGTMARHVFKGKVHIGYLAAIVAASNAGGSGSVVGDTTTTMMWIDGISPLRVVEAYVAATAGFLIYGIPAALQQHRHSPIIKDAPRGLHIDWSSVGVVAAILVIAISANVIANLKFPAVLDVVPVIGLAVWIVILATAPLRRPDWKIMPETFKGTIFLLALVTNASFMPVEELPPASWQTALGLGFLSSVFDNIPLTALALKQGGYDWGFLAYCGGFRRLDDLVRLVRGRRDLQHVSGSEIGRPLAAARLVYRSGVCRGFFVMLAIVGWNPDAPHKKRAEHDTSHQLAQTFLYHSDITLSGGRARHFGMAFWPQEWRETAMPMLENTQTRLSIKSGSTTLTLDKTSGKTTLQRKMMLWQKKPIEKPLSEVVSVSVDASVDRASGVEICHTMVIFKAGDAWALSAADKNEAQGNASAIRDFLHLTTGG